MHLFIKIFVVTPHQYISGGGESNIPFYSDLAEIYPHLLLCSHSPNDVPSEPQRNTSIAAVRGTVHPPHLSPNPPFYLEPCFHIV